jgi:hypothetical protein
MGGQSWMTPNLGMLGSDRASDAALDRDSQRHQVHLSHQARAFWPSPRSEDSQACGNHPGAVDSLTGATQNWPSPRARDHHEESQSAMERRRAGAGGPMLSSTASNWLTPKTPSGGGSGCE